MKKFIVTLMMLFVFGPANAFIPVATEITQILNNIELVMQYAQQVQQYRTQLQQYEAQLKNLEQNPGAATKDTLSGVINSVGNAMSAQNAIGGNMAQIDSNFSKQFGNQAIGSFSEKFKSWSDTTRDTLGGALRSAGLHRDAYASDAQALQALFNQSQSSSGAVAAIQQLSALTTMQVQQSQKLGDLLSTQNIAASTWMTAQTNKDQAQADITTKVMRMDKPGPLPDPSKYKKGTF